MAKLNRVTQKLFGSAAGAAQVAQFGSLFAGAPATTTSVAAMMALGNWLTGWFGAAIGGNSPAIEDLNAVHTVFAYQLGYLMQAGIAEWDSGTTYYIGSFVNIAGAQYVSLTDDNLNNDPLVDTVNWRKIGGTVMTAEGDMIYGGVGGALERLEGNVSNVRQVLTQLGTGIASAPPEWTDYIPPTIVKLTGSGNYNWPVGAMYARGVVVGGGGGGGATGNSNSGSAGSAGNATTLGAVTCGGGLGGGASSSNGGGGGGAVTGSLGTVIRSINGSTGQTGINSGSPALNVIGGNGGVSPLGGAGSGGNPGSAAIGETGSGGGGAGAPVAVNSAGGGGAGAYYEFQIDAPSGSIAYSVGTGGTGGVAGSGGFAGGNGAIGSILLEVYWQ